jgi:glyoxylase-like metal-dependent hydrolase (beta-lactamase superfamily II)
MPSIAPIGERIDKYMDVPTSAVGPAVDPAKGYRLQDLGSGLYMITDNTYQSMFIVYDKGVVVIDAPPSYAAHIPAAIAEVTDKPITHVVYSHSHVDHIAGVKSLGGHPVIIAHEETKGLLQRAADPNRPLPTKTFSSRTSVCGSPGQSGPSGKRSRMHRKGCSSRRCASSRTTGRRSTTGGRWKRG